MFVVCMVYIGLFTIVAPAYIVCKSKKEYIIEYFGLIVKVGILFLAHFSHDIDEVNVMVGTSLLIAAQLVVSLIYGPQQYSGKNDQASKLAYLNLLDLIMYIILTVSSFICMFCILFKDSMNDYLFHIMFIIIFTCNIFYVIIWILAVLGYLWKHFSITPRYARLYTIVTCGRQQPLKKEEPEEVELQNMQPEEDEEKKLEIKKLEILIQHLKDVQNEINNTKLNAQDNVTEKGK